MILKNDPKIEFQILDAGFKLIDRQSERKSGVYAYSELQSIELNKPWFPRLAKWLRAITWVLNGVPYFPDADSYKKSNIIIHLKNAKVGIWLTDTKMVDNARKIKTMLDQKTNNQTG